MSDRISLLYPKGYENTMRKNLKDFGFIKPLMINDMVVIRSDSFRGIPDLDLTSFFTYDEDVIGYRLDVVEDLLNNDKLFETFEKSIGLIYDIGDIKKSIRSDFSIDSALSSARYLEMYIEIIDLFYDALKDVTPVSEGIKCLKEYIENVKTGEEYKNLCENLSGMQVKFGNIKSITVGINLNNALVPVESGIISINDKPFKSGNIINRLTSKKDGMDTLMSNLFPLPKGMHQSEREALNLSVASSLKTIYSKSLRDFAPAIEQYFKVNTSIFSELLEDIRFLTGAVSFIRKMKAEGRIMCKPSIRKVEDKALKLTDVYNPILAMKEENIVSNSFEYDENGRFFIVTGPNHGGKSIFAYSIGMAQALFQLGLFVPAREAVMSPVTGIFTHFPASDENNFGKGRLESECQRLSEIIKKLSDTDLLLMDESFSSTSGLEASYIASEVLTGIGVIGCAGVYVTHIHDLTQKTGEFNEYPGNKGKIDNLVARMEDEQNGIRSYKVTRTKPDGLSYAKDIASKYGLNIEGMIK